MQNLLGIGNEKILLLTSVIFRGDYHGAPERLVGKHKINVKSVQEEAGLSLGTAYRYSDVMDAIATEKQSQAKMRTNARKSSVRSDLERHKEEKLRSTEDMA